MSDYAIIVDDSDSRVLYGPSDVAWTLSDTNGTYKGTTHNAMTQDANLTFSFVGGREVFIQGNVVGDNNASVSARFPVFQVDSQDFLTCSPSPPQNGGQFICSISLSSTITNRTLIMIPNPKAAIQQFHIDYIRYGTSTQVAASQNRTVVYVKVPDNSTLGLSFDSDWQYQSIGGKNHNKMAMQTSTPSAKVSYNFVGDSVAWWGCCMPAGTSSNTANVTYSIDGGGALSVPVGENFIQGTQCTDEKLLFQIQQGQLIDGNHILDVVYHGDNTKMPLTLCALAATPSNFNALDIQLSNISTIHSSSFILSPSATSIPSSLPEDDNHSKSALGKRTLASLQE